MTNGQLTIVVGSCDAYSDLWDSFFDILSRRWPKLPYEIVLNTEAVDYTGGKLPVKTLHPRDPNAAWTARFRAVLEQLDSELILLLLDDFFLTGEVDSAAIENYCNWMLDNPNIATIHFWPMDDALPSARYPGLGLRPKDGLYRMSAFAGLWRRQRLIEFLEVDENAWQWEYAGTRRYADVDDEFYALLRGTPLPIPFDNFEYGIIGGKWMPKTAALFASYGIPMDFDRRGFYQAAHKALLPQTKAAFELDSKLYCDLGSGYREADAQAVKQIQKDGRFVQTFPVSSAAGRVVRWDPSSTLGFSIRNLRVTAELADGIAVELKQKTLGGNHVVVDDALIFIQEDPQILAVLPRGTVCVTFSGEASCPLPEALLRRALRRRPRDLGFRLHKLINRFI